jgi:hypothetical protein
MTSVLILWRHECENVHCRILMICINVRLVLHGAHDVLLHIALVHQFSLEVTSHYNFNGHLNDPFTDNLGLRSTNKMPFLHSSPLCVSWLGER